MSTDTRVSADVSPDRLIELAYQLDVTLPQARDVFDLAVAAIDRRSAPQLAASLDDPVIAAAYLKLIDRLFGLDASIAYEAQAGRAFGDGVDGPGVRYVMARAAELRGDLDRWQTHLARAVEADASYAPALFDQGFVAFLTGDAPAATHLLGQVDDLRADSMLHTLSHYPPRRARVGRNDLCPCGSSVKAKRCCGVGPEPHPLADRAIWLWEKVAWALRRPPHQPRYHDLVAELADVAFIDPSTGDGMGILADEATEAIALLDGQLLGEVLDSVGSLLPDDERRLGHSWRDIRHRLWSVTSTRPGHTLTLLDIHTGDEIEATNGDVSRCTQPGELVYAAVVPTGNGWIMPRHHIGLSPHVATMAARWIDERDDPMEVAQRILIELDDEEDGCPGHTGRRASSS